MTWYITEQVAPMPSVQDVTRASTPQYSEDQYASPSNFLLQPGLDAGTLDASTYTYLHTISEPLGCYQQPYGVHSVNPAGTAYQHQQHFRENTFVWVGANNFYPSCEQRSQSEPYSPQRHHGQRRLAGERSEKAGRRRRAPTVAQRRAANIRERRRMYNLNEAFDCLRQRIPTFAYEKRLSRIETLRLAISYISFMAGIVNGEDPSTLRVGSYDSGLCRPAALTQTTLRDGDSVAESRSSENDYDDGKDDDEDEEGEDGVSGNEEEEDSEDSSPDDTRCDQSVLSV
ncbi:unnamed protein product [Lymnaea stagnalis]|uniref:BHLH domain-containing protein n=1 Tax=Lymnaea stagnalis TaxID=6523 RepID=A0AAV2IE45_LYMST